MEVSLVAVVEAVGFAREGSHGCGFEGGLYIRCRSWSITCTKESVRCDQTRMGDGKTHTLQG